MNRYLALLLAALTSAEMQAYQLAPRLVVAVAVDQLRTDYMEAFAPLYSSTGFRRLLSQGVVCDGGYPFTPVDRASAAATLSTGTTPYYHGIISSQWLDRSTLQSVDCTLDEKRLPSPARLLTTTLGDEMKISSEGVAKVYAVAADRSSAILSAGHSADGAYWLSSAGQWTSSTFYASALPQWLRAYSRLGSDKATDSRNDRVVSVGLQAVEANAMGRDDTSDLLCLTLSATRPDGTPARHWQTEMEGVYMQLDRTLSRLIEGLDKMVGMERVLLVLTSTGYAEDAATDLSRFRIPTGTFYINRTAALLNVYLSAIYGQGRWVEQCYANQMYLNRQLIEQRRVSMAEVRHRAEEFLVQCAGVADVYTTDRLQAGNNDIQKIRAGYNPNLSGDLIVEVAPGWKLLNEDNHQSYTARAAFIPFPIIFLGAGLQPKHLNGTVTVEHIAPTVAKAIRIRAPNACQAEPLF